jgi:leucyl aminopeptidase
MIVNLETNLAVNCDALVVLAFDADELSGSALELDGQATAFLSDLKSRGELACKTGKVNLFYNLPGSSCPVVVVVGAGTAERWGAQEAYRCAAAASKTLASKKRTRVVFNFGNMSTQQNRSAVAGSMNGCHGQDVLKAEPSLHPIEQISWIGINSADLSWGKEVGQAMLLVRELVNLPANIIYPETFVARAAEVAVASGLEMEVWDEMRLRKERCGSLLGVAQGSTRPPRLLILRYPGKKAQAPLALVGKGVTFDSGGLSLKPTDSMLTMKCDMAGAATVLGTMQAIANLKLDTPVIGLMGLVENMVSGTSFKLGDVLTARNGKTIEIHNTDAEGRLVLADVLDVAIEHKPAGIIDLATLTGACVVALGVDISGLMTNNPQLQTRLQQAAQATGEEVWPLPMTEHFSEQVKGKVADLKNMGDGRWGGAITAAKFLEEFVGGYPWVHIDIAGPAFYDAPKPFQDAGGTGAMLPTLVELIRSAS